MRTTSVWCFLAYVDAPEAAQLAPVADDTARVTAAATYFIRSFTQVMDYFITFVLSLGALVVFQTKCMIDIAGIHICSVLLDTKIMDFQLFYFTETLLYHTICRMSPFFFIMRIFF